MKAYELNLAYQLPQIIEKGHCSMMVIMDKFKIKAHCTLHHLIHVLNYYCYQFLFFQLYLMYLILNLVMFFVLFPINRNLQSMYVGSQAIRKIKPSLISLENDKAAITTRNYKL